MRSIGGEGLVLILSDQRLIDGTVVNPAVNLWEERRESRKASS